MLVFRKSKSHDAPERASWCNRCGVRLRSEPSRLALSRPPGKETLPAIPIGRAKWPSVNRTLPPWSLCTRCYEERMACAACGMSVGAEGVTHEGGEQIYCRRCYELNPRCDTCGLPAGIHPWTRCDGRVLCDRCHTTAVIDPATAHALYRRVRASLNRLLGLRLGEPCQLKVAGRGQMIRLLDKSALFHLDAGSKGRCFGLFLREGKHRAIFVEQGLPRIVLFEVLAHEYAHAWQNEHCPPDAPLEVQEGFAEWVAYKLLQSWGCGKRLSRMLRRDDIYGIGLRKMLEWERIDGVSGVLRRVAAW